MYYVFIRFYLNNKSKWHPAERQRDRETERQRDRETERERDREKQYSFWRHYYTVVLI
jgi:hypothetical protein